MLDWQVEEEIPQEPLSEESPRQWRIDWRGVAIILAIITVTTAIVLGALRYREEQLRVELNAVIQREATTMSYGIADATLAFADPSAPPQWMNGYTSIYNQPASLPPPTIQQVALRDTIATAEVLWATTPPLLEPRAYRLVDGEWRRTPLFIPQTPADELEDLRTTHFALVGPVSTVNDLATTPGLQLNLEGLRRRVATYWQETWDEYFLTVRVYPAEFAPAVHYSDARNLHVNSVNLTPFNPALPLSPQSQYRIGVTEGVVKWLTTPEWVRQLRLSEMTTMSAADIEASHDWFVMLDLLQAAEARHWALSESEVNALRAYWRTEIGNQWVDPFTAPLPEAGRAWDEAESQRYAMINLLLERQIAVGDVGTIGRLAGILQEYPPVYFSAEQFFSALIGGSPSDVQMQMELWLERGE
jgi:hypothetical protein